MHCLMMGFRVLEPLPRLVSSVLRERRPSPVECCRAATMKMTPAPHLPMVLLAMARATVRRLIADRASAARSLPPGQLAQPALQPQERR